MRLINPRKIPTRKVTNRIQEILKACEGKRVLHFGCADVPFTRIRGEQLLHFRLSAQAKELWGVDLSEEGISAMREMGFQDVLVADAEDLPQRIRDKEFDVIVAGEIIEHLGNPARFLQEMRSIMTDNTELLLTTINAYALKLFLFALIGREKVHEDHNYYYSHFTVQQLIGKYGLHCRETYYYQEVNGSGLSLLVDRCLAVCSRLFPPLSDGLIVKVKRAQLPV